MGSPAARKNPNSADIDRAVKVVGWTPERQELIARAGSTLAQAADKEAVRK
jgi:hypothetical protein